MNESCNIIPQSYTGTGKQQDSPLFLEIFNLVNGDRNRAVSLYQKATSAEVVSTARSLPKGLVSFYEDSFTDQSGQEKTPTLATVLKVSDMAQEISTEEIQDYLNRTIDTSIDKVEDFKKIKDFNTNNDWNIHFRAVKGDGWSMHAPFQLISVNDETPDTGVTNDSFQATVYENLTPIFKSLGLYSQALNEMFERWRLLRPNFYGEDIADVLANLFRYAEGNPTRFSQPRYKEMAMFIEAIMRNHPLYPRLMNVLESNDEYKDISKNEDLSDEERLHDALYILLAGIIKGETPSFARNTVRNKLAERLLKEFRNKMRQAAVANPACKYEGVVDAVYKANDHYTVVNERFIEVHPILQHQSKINSVTQKARVALDEIQEDILRYLTLIKKIKSRDSAEVEEVQDLATAWKHEVKNIGSIGRGGLTTLDNDPQFQEILDAINRLVQLLEANWDSLNVTVDTLKQSQEAELLSNNLLCGKLQSIIHTIRESEEIIDKLLSLRDFEVKHTSNGDNKFFVGNLSDRLTRVQADLGQKKAVVRECMRKSVVNELMKIYPNPIFTLPTGERVTIDRWLEATKDESPLDINGLERQLTSVSQISNPLLTLIDSYKKRIAEEGRQETMRVRDEILEAANKLKSKDTSWMFKKQVDDSGAEHPTGKYIMDYDRGAFAQAFTEMVTRVKKDKSFSQERKQEEIAKWFNDHTEVREDLDGNRHPSREYFPSEEFQFLTYYQQEYWKVFMRNKGILVSYFPDMNFAVDDGIFIRKDNREILKSDIKQYGVKGFWRAVGRMIHSIRSDNSSTVETNVDEYVLRDFDKEAVYDLPTFYNMLNPNETMDDISTDTTSALINYAEVMTNSAALKNVINLLNTATDVIANQKYRTSGRRSVEILKDGKFMTKNESPVLKDELGSLAVYKDWLKAQVYRKYNIKGKSKRLRNIAGSYMWLVNFGTLALNSTSAISNIIQGLAQLVPTAIGGYFFNFKDLTKACALYDKCMWPIKGNSFIADIGSTTKTNDLNLFSRKFHIMQDFSQDIREVNFDRSRAGRLISSNALYFLLHAGEHYLQHIGAFATMYNDRNLVMNESGNKITAFDAYNYIWIDPNNHSAGKKMVLKEGLVADINGSSKTIISNEEMRRRAVEKHTNVMDKSLLSENEISEAEWVSTLSQKMASINHYMHGIYNKEDQASAQYNTLANVLFMYRKYLIPSLNRRFGKSKYIAALDANVEGYYVSLGKFSRQLAKEIRGTYHKSFENLNEEQKSIVRDYFDANNIPYVTNEDIEKVWSTYSRETRANILFGETSRIKIAKSILDDMQKSNLKQAFAEAGLFFSLVIANLILDFDDEDDDTLGTAATKYFLRRAQTEIGALTPLSSLLAVFYLVDKDEHKELRSLASGNMLAESLQMLNQPIVGMNTMKDVMETMALLNPKTYTTEVQGGKLKGKTKAYRIFYRHTPLRQLDDWTVESFHQKENWYKQ